MPPPSPQPERAKVADFYAARSATITPLPWSTFAPPFPLPMRPQPVPPIFQPEIPAEAVHYMALHPRREMWLGWSTWKVLIGQMFAAGFLDRYLARVGYSGQESDEVALGGPGNLFESVDGDYGAHGRFDAEARSRSSELRLATHPVTTAVGIGCVAILAASVIAAAVRSSSA